MSARGPRKHDPVSLVLGPTDAGPFALLGLPATDVGMPQVLAALHLRLEQVRASPHAATPAAEDVRLALHAAAAQLCDPAVRRLLLGTWGTGAAAQSGVAPDGNDKRYLIERDLHIAVGLSGGWNAAAMQRLALACEGRGVSLQQLSEVLDVIMAKPVAGSGARTQGARPVVVRRSSPGIETLPRELLVVIGVGATLIVGVVAGLIIFLAPGAGSATKQDVVATLEGAVAASPLKLDAPSVVPGTDASPELAIGDARSIDREIASLAKALGSEEPAEAAAGIDARFQVAFEAFSTNWHLLRREEITAVVSSLIDVSFAAAQKQRESEVVGAIERAMREPPTGRRGVRSVVAAGAVAARLLHERDLPRSMRESLEAALRMNAATARIGASPRFELAAEQIVLPLADALGAGPSWADLGTWKGFLDVRDAAMGDRTRLKDVATIAALRAVLRSGGTDHADEAVVLLVDVVGEDA